MRGWLVAALITVAGCNAQEPTGSQRGEVLRLPEPLARAEGRLPYRRVVNLDQPGALEILAHENPAHYAAVKRILAEARYLPPESIADWLKTNFDARDASLAPLVLKTSYPPKGQLSFTLDDARYSVFVTVDVPPAIIGPLGRPVR